MNRSDSQEELGCDEDEGGKMNRLELLDGNLNPQRQEMMLG
jgi:hypothetical protein